MSNVQFDPEHEQDASAEQHTSDQTTITVSSVEKMMASARPRLLRLAHLRGIAPDALDDVVQETLTAAWQRLDHLRSPERFHAWLDGICRNMCLRWHEESALLTRRHIPLAMCSAKELSHDEDHYTEDIPNPRVLDPVEELSQQDLAVLLDHALGYLPNETRKLIELCYFAEMPQREAALHLGMTISALESRLYRARRQLHEVLSGDLRGEAEAFGLAMGGETASGWRETREWCMLCGRHRLRGCFEQSPDGRTILHIRCPGCSNQIDNDLVLPRGMRSFRPALKRVLTWSATFLEQGLQRDVQACPRCGAVGQGEIVGTHELTLAPQHRSQAAEFVFCCPACGNISIYIGNVIWSHPTARQFIAQHPRWVYEPEMLLDYDGQPAIKLVLKDVMSHDCLMLFVHHQTLQILAVQ